MGRRLRRAIDEVGPLRRVMVRRPGEELAAIRADAWDEELGALVDPEGHWYWTGRKAPDLERVAAQHEGLVDALRAEGVEVDVLEPLGGRFVKSVYTRDPSITVPGGAIVGPHGRADAPRRGAARHARAGRRGDADPRHDHGHGHP